MLRRHLPSLSFVAVLTTLVAIGAAAFIYLDRKVGELVEAGELLPVRVREAASGQTLRLNLGISDGIAKLAVHRLLRTVLEEPHLRLLCHEGEFQPLLGELAHADLQAVGEPPALAPLRALSRARAANVLRHWLRLRHGTAPSAAQLDELLDQLDACTTRGHRIRLKVGAGFVERTGDRIAFNASV